MMGQTIKIEGQTVCVLCGGLNPGGRWLGLPCHSTCTPPSEVSQTYKAYSMIAGLSTDAIRDLCRQVGVKFTYRYRNANGRMSRLFHDRSYLTYQIVKVKGGSAEAPTPTPDEDQDETDVEPTPVEPTPVEPTPVEPTPVEPTPVEPTTPEMADITPSLNLWVTWVQKFREAAQRRGLKVTITPRASARGAIMLAHGIDLGNVALLEVGNRMTPQDWANLQTDAGISAPSAKQGAHKHLRHKQTDLLMALVRAGIHVWLKGPAGSGKSTAARLAAKFANLPFYFTGAVDSKYDLTGFVDAQGRAVNTQFRRAFTQGGLFLFDEIDGSTPSSLLSFNGMLANLSADFPGCDTPTDAHGTFSVVAAANTNGSGATAQYSGRFKQDDAATDRFTMMLWEIDLDLEREIALQVARKALARGVA